MIHLVVRLVIKPSKVKDFLKLALRHRNLSLEEPGCRRFELLIGKAGYALVEAWRDQAALEEHRQSAHYAEWKAQVPTLEVTHERHEYREVQTAFVNGCFDGEELHVGHKKLLAEAAAQGDWVTVAINSDKSVTARKGEGRPIVKESKRAARLAPYASEVLVFADEDELSDLLQQASPDVLVKGADWEGKEITGEEYAGRMHFVELVPGVKTQ